MDSYHEEINTPLLAPAISGPSSKILSEVSEAGQRLHQTKVYPLIHLIRVDVLSHIGTFTLVQTDETHPSHMNNS